MMYVETAEEENDFHGWIYNHNTSTNTTFSTSTGEYQYQTLQGYNITTYAEPDNYTSVMPIDNVNLITNSSLINQTFYIGLYYTINLIDEQTQGPFQVSNTNSTTLQVFCDDKVLTEEFNVSSNNNSVNLFIDCEWDFFLVEVAIETDTYFRTYTRNIDEKVIDMYMADITTSLVYQINIILNDLTGQYSDGQIIVEKKYNDSTREITTQYFDIENKATLYLIKDNVYILSVNDGNGNERRLGYFIADAAEEKTLNLPNIEFGSDTDFGINTYWEYDLSNETAKLYYVDNSETTSNLTFTVKRNIDNSLLYEDTVVNPINTTFIYMFPYVTDYTACIEGYSTQYGEIKDCKFHKSEENAVGNWSGYDQEEEQEWSGWIAGIILGITLFGFIAPGTARFTLLAIFFELVIFVSWLQWLTFGSTWANVSIVTFVGIVAIISNLKGEVN